MTADIAYQGAGGPLSGLSVLEVGGIGPGPYCGMLLADLGADVTRIERVDAISSAESARFDLVSRGKRSIGVDLRSEDGLGLLLRLVKTADALFESNRPGVAERLGFGPSACLAANPRLVYGRMTGWGQAGPLARLAGHDINYIAVSGALHPIGPPDGPPVPPLHHLGNYGGGGTMLAFGVLAAVIHAKNTGEGQVVDAAMVDGTALMTTYLHGELAAGRWRADRGTNILDGGAPFYRCYECSDGQFVAVGAIEPTFSAQLLDVLAIATDDPMRAQWYEQDKWPEFTRRVDAIFRTRSRDQWMALAEGRDACLTPVLSPAEASVHPHNAYRDVFVESAGIVQPAPAPRFSATPGAPGLPATPRADTDAVLARHGYNRAEIESLRERGIVG